MVEKGMDMKRKSFIILVCFIMQIFMNTRIVIGSDALPEDATRRGLPAPLQSPPFPGSDWAGSPLIGVPDTTPDYLLQKALFGDALKASRIKVYGWVNASVNFSTSNHSNVPMSYNIDSNRVVLNQLVLRVERMPDTVQTDHTDWGFRISNLYGIDYRYTTARGYFSDQLLKHNNLYGWDPVELYGLYYIPWVAEGMVLKFGRYISPPDIEAQLAPDNYLLSHSLMFTVDPYTFTGLQSTVRLHPQWQIILGVHGGSDMAPWTKCSQLNGQALVRWVTQDNNDSIYAGINSLGSGKYRHEHDNLQHIVATWGHRFNEKIHMQTESYYIWQRDAAKGGTAIDGPSKSYYKGTGLGPIIDGRSSAIGFVNYVEIMLSDKDYLSVRNDMLRDMQGQRTGFATTYTSHTLGWRHQFNDLLSIRPEIRYEHAYSAKPYDNGREKSQYTASVDFIHRF